MTNQPEHARKSATMILEALEASHIGFEVFNAGRPTPAGIYAVVSSIVLAIGPAEVEVVAVDGCIGTAPQEVRGVIIAGDTIVRFTGETDDRDGLTPEFTVEARSFRDLIAVTVKSGNLFAADDTKWPGRPKPDWPGRPEVGLAFRDGEPVRLPLSRHANQREREMVARFVERVPSLLNR